MTRSSRTFLPSWTSSHTPKSALSLNSLRCFCGCWKVGENGQRRRYRLYALQGPSQAAKTSFVKSLFKRPFVLTVQNATTLNLRDFKYGFHDCLILDNVNTLKFILDYRAILQSNLDTHVLGDSATNVYSYTIFLWGTPILITLAPWLLSLCYVS